MIPRGCLLRLTLGIALSAAVMSASVIYDNAGAASSGVDPVNGFGPLYDSFTSPDTGELESLTLVLAQSSAPTGTLDIGLYADSSELPGSIIAPLSVVSSALLSASPAPYDVVLSVNPTLVGGTRYWIGLSGNTAAEWSWSLGPSGVELTNEFYANESGAFPDAGNGPYQMRVTTNAPEPASVLLLIGAGLALPFLLKSLRRI